MAEQCYRHRVKVVGLGFWGCGCFTFSSFLLAGKEMHTLKTLGTLKVNAEGCVSFNIPDTLLRS